MRLWLAVAVLLTGVLLPCGSEHNVAKRQIGRGGQRGRTTAAPVATTAEPEYEYEDEEEEASVAPPVSYQRRPVVVPEEKVKDHDHDHDDEPPPVRSQPGTSIRRPQAPPKVTTESEEEYNAKKDGVDYDLPEPVRLPPGQRKPKTTTRRPYVPDPNNENPDEGGYLRKVVTSGPPRTFSRRPATRRVSTTTSAPTTAASRSPVRRPNPNRSGPSRPAGPPKPAAAAPKPAAGAAPPPDDIIAKILGGNSPIGGIATSPSPARPARPAAPAKPSTTTEAPTDEPVKPRARPAGRRQSVRTTSAPKTTEAVVEDDEELTAPSPPPARRTPNRQATRRPAQRRRPTTAASEDSEEVIDKPTTPIPKRKPAGSRVRFAVKPPKPVVVLEQPYDDDDVEDEYEEQSVPREVTQKAPPRPPTTTTTTQRPVARFGNASRKAAADKKFRGRFRGRDDDDEGDEYPERPYRSRSRTRGRSGSSRYREDDYDEEYDDYDDRPPRRNRNNGRNKDINNGRRRGNRGRGPTTSPRPSTRTPPLDLEVRKDGRIIDYLGDPNLPRELTGFSLVDYPFYTGVPEDITFDCNKNTDGFYASIPHFCQVFHYCHSGNRYSFVCPNYTLYDQTTFTCRFANTVDCPKSANFYNRNDALYKEDKKTTDNPITTQLIPDSKPAKKP